MDEIKGSKFQVNSVNIRVPVNVNSKTQAIQNINFQEVLNSFSSTPNISSKTSNATPSILLDSVYTFQQELSNEAELNKENRPNLSKNESTTIKTTLENINQSPIFSEFNPQKTVNIDKQQFNFSNLNDETKNELKKELPTKNISENPKKLLPEKNNTVYEFYGNETYTDTFVKSEIVEEDSSFYEKQQDNNGSEDTSNSNFSGDNNNFNENENQRGKRHQELVEYQRKEKNLEFEIARILETYNLKKPSHSIIGIKEGTHEYNEWLRGFISSTKNKHITDTEIKTISEYLSNNLKGSSFFDRQIFKSIVFNTLKNKQNNINSNIIVNFDIKAMENFYRIIPPSMLKGFIKKSSKHLNKRREKSNYLSSIYKLINGIKLSMEESTQLAYTFNDTFDMKELIDLSKLFEGSFENISIDNVRKIINKLYNKNYLPPGFLGCLYDILNSLYIEGYKEKSKQVLKFIEVYSNGLNYTKNESKALGELIANKFFNNSKLNKNKTIEIIGKLIYKEKVEFISLDLISRVSDKNPLFYLPSRIDPDMKYFLKNNSLVIEESSKNNGASDIFIFGGKLKLFGINNLKKNIIRELLLIGFNNDKVFKIRIDQESNFREILEKDVFQIVGISLINDNKATIIDLRDDFFVNSEILAFQPDNITEMFYFGTLKVYLDVNTNSVNKISLQNDYHNFLKQNSDILNYKEINKSIKINPKLHKHIINKG